MDHYDWAYGDDLDLRDDDNEGPQCSVCGWVMEWYPCGQCGGIDPTGEDDADETGEEPVACPLCHGNGGDYYCDNEKNHHKQTETHSADGTEEL